VVTLSKDRFNSKKSHVNFVVMDLIGKAGMYKTLEEEIDEVDTM
jgi:hypothetical protein